MNDVNRHFEKHILLETTGSTVIHALASQCSDVSNRVLKQALQFGAVWLTSGGRTDRVRRAKKIVSAGDELHIYFDEKILFSETEPAQFLADEKYYSIWNKPCGMFSQGTKWGDHSAICRWVELHGLAQNNLPQRPAFLVHRLDRATQGLIIVAHSKTAAAKMSELFSQREICKHYIAKVSGHFPQELIGTYLDNDVDGKSAKTKVLDSHYDVTLNDSTIRLQLETGRKHQIRQHLSAHGFPIIGDRLYGGELRVKTDLQLKSCYLEFLCPFSREEKQYQLL